MIDTILSRLKADEPGAGPKYQRLRDLLLDAIASGDWSPGARLPTEAELSRVLPFSLGTIQKAYSELVREGLVVRSRGRGSFVAAPHRQMAEPWHCRFLNEAGTILPVYPRLIAEGPAEQDARWAGLFGAAARVVVIDRAFSIDSEFEVLSRFYVPDDVAAALLSLPRDDVVSANFKHVMSRRFGTRIARIVQTIGLVGAETWSALAMAGEPHLGLEATAYAGDGEVAYFQRLYIPRNTRRLLFDSDLRS